MYHQLVFFFKQKTAYEMRISDWSSDVCSSDLTLKMTVPSLPEDGERSATPTGATPRESRDSLEPAVKTKRVDVGGILVEVLADNRDSGWYLQRKTFEEKASLLYRLDRKSVV